MTEIVFEPDEAIIMREDELFSWEQFNDEDKNIEEIVLTTKNFYVQWVESRRFKKDSRWVDKYKLKDIKCVDGLPTPASKINMGGYSRYYLQFFCYNQRIILGFYGEDEEEEKKVVQWANAINYQILGPNCPKIAMEERPDKHPFISFIKKNIKDEAANVKGNLVCSECGYFCENYAEFCSSCGKRLNVTQWEDTTNGHMEKLVKENCPSCAAPLPIKGTESQVFCEYCGTLVVVDEKALHISRMIRAQQNVNESFSAVHGSFQNSKIQSKEMSRKVAESLKKRAWGLIDDYKAKSGSYEKVDRGSDKIPFYLAGWFIFALAFVGSWFTCGLTYIAGIILTLIRLGRYPNNREGSWVILAILLGVILLVIAGAII